MDRLWVLIWPFGYHMPSQRHVDVFHCLAIFSNISAINCLHLTTQWVDKVMIVYCQESVLEHPVLTSTGSLNHSIFTHNNEISYLITCGSTFSLVDHWLVNLEVATSYWLIL